jgi:TolB-like protein
MKHRRPFRLKNPIFVGIVFSASIIWAQTAALTTSPKPAGKLNLAVLTMKSTSGVSAGETEVITDRLRGELFNTGKVNVMERDQMQEVLKEQGFQQSGACSNEQCMVEMGQLLGVAQLVTGSLGKVGSMFLVNFRVIDVKTAKIVKVVSRDIKGDLEEVVSQLPGIALELVSDVAAPPIEQVKPIEKKEVQKPIEQVKADTPKVEEKKEEPKEEEKPEISDRRTELNKNRGGFRLSFSYLPGILQMNINDKSIKPNTLSDAYDTYSWNETGLIKIDALFFIKAGPFLTVNIGPNFSWDQATWTDHYHLINGSTIYDTISFFHGAIGIQPGLNFVKRWHPLKLNVGAFVDINVPWMSSELTHDSTNSLGLNSAGYVSDTSASNFGIGFNFAYGVRTGIELLINNRIGFNVDFVFRYSAYDLSFITTENQNHLRRAYDYKESNPGVDPVKVNVLLPMFGFDAGVNFYF